MQEEVLSILNKMVTHTKTYSKGQFIFNSNQTTKSFGIVNKGTIQIERNDFWGNRTIMDTQSKGGIFAETYALTGQTMMVDVIALEDCTIDFIDIEKALSIATPQQINQFYSIMLKISSTKNLNLSRKIIFTSPKSIRERITAFLTYQSQIHNSMVFDINLDRQQLSDFLQVERSALSKELGKMRDEGLLETKKNHFKLIK